MDHIWGAAYRPRKSQLTMALNFGAVGKYFATGIKNDPVFKRNSIAFFMFKFEQFSALFGRKHV